MAAQPRDRRQSVKLIEVPAGIQAHQVFESMTDVARDFMPLL
jgi:hypothetical protein